MKNLTPGTIARTICLALALLNQILIAAGKSPLPIQDDTVNVLVSTIATVVASGASWWKNNSFTPQAQEADELMHELKERKKQSE